MNGARRPDSASALRGGEGGVGTRPRIDVVVGRVEEDDGAGLAPGATHDVGEVREGVAAKRAGSLRAEQHALAAREGLVEDVLDPRHRRKEHVLRCRRSRRSARAGRGRCARRGRSRRPACCRARPSPRRCFDTRGARSPPRTGSRGSRSPRSPSRKSAGARDSGLARGALADVRPLAGERDAGERVHHEAQHGLGDEARRRRSELARIDRSRSSCRGARAGRARA